MSNIPFLLWSRSVLKNEDKVVYDYVDVPYTCPYLPFNISVKMCTYWIYVYINEEIYKLNKKKIQNIHNKVYIV